MRIAVDFDDVLYPYHHYLKKRIHDKWGVDLSTKRITTFYYELLPEMIVAGVTREALWKEVQAAWWQAEDHTQSGLLDPYAPKVLRGLAKRHDIVLCTARHQAALPHIESFLARHKIKLSEILLGREDKTGFDVLIDDFPRHAEQNAATGGYSLLYTIDENSNYDESRHPRIFRVHNWRDVEDTIRRLEDRGAKHA